MTTATQRRITLNQKIRGLERFAALTFLTGLILGAAIVYITTGVPVTDISTQLCN